VFLVDAVNKFINRGENRSVQIKRNIVVSFLVRSLSVGINLAVVSLAIGYVDAAQYGVWVTLTSIISWFTFFDFGMGNGLRNRLATALAFKEYDKARKLISTTYTVFTFLALAVFVLFWLVNPFINWVNILKVPSITSQNLSLVILVLVGTLCIQFVAQLINTVLNALQVTAKVEFLSMLGQAGMLITLLILKYTIPGSLQVLIIALNVIPLLIIISASVILYTGKYKSIAPSVKAIDLSYAKNILNLGGAFFLIQIGSLVLHQTDNIIITRILGPEAVTRFNVTYKLFYVILIIFSIVVAPYWSAFTDAYAKNDYDWIRKSVKRLREAWLFTSFVIVPVFFLLSKFAINILFPGISGIGWSLLSSMAVYMICSTCLSFTCYFLYGIGKLRILLILYMVVTLVNVPLGVMLGKWLGIEGVVLANIVTYVFMNVILWIQTNKIVQQKAVGIWIR
jgi:O-antigen/teichoic acid export membrane protein